MYNMILPFSFFWFFRLVDSKTLGVDVVFEFDSLGDTLISEILVDVFVEVNEVRSICLVDGEHPFDDVA
jgi:hypothetical protein